MKTMIQGKGNPKKLVRRHTQKVKETQERVVEWYQKYEYK